MSRFNFTITCQPADQTKIPIHFNLCSGEHWYLSSDSGLFISNLFDWLEGKKFLPHTFIALEQNDRRDVGLFAVKKQLEVVRLSTNDIRTGQYYQQRYQATENDHIIRLSDFLEFEKDTFYADLIFQMGLDKLMHESLNKLSTGEYKKACLIKAALRKPMILIIEDPYPGIDQQGRKLIDLLFEHLSNDGTRIVVVGSSVLVPEFVTHCMMMQRDFLVFSGRKEFLPVREVEKDSVVQFSIPEVVDFPFTNAFQLVDVTVRYDNRLILGHLHWTVAEGEKWQLIGNNGSGKSLLLSLIYADNPQVYCNDVRIFDHKRGTGENIWDVKQHIGFYSSEMFRFFDKFRTVDETIQSIVSQHPYKKRVLKQHELQFKSELLEYFKLSDDQSTPLIKLSAVNQRVVMLIAILLKNAPLLVLDEPFEHFDQQLTDKFLWLIDLYAKDRTLVYVTHNQQKIPKCIDKYFQINEGKGWIKKIISA